MELTKADALNQIRGQSSLSNQQSLVQKIQGGTPTKPIKMVIPGGKTLASEISKSELPDAIFTWLRRVRHFKEVTISFCSDSSLRKTKSMNAVDLDSSHTISQWERMGKKWLAERLAEVLSQENILAVKVDKNAIYAIINIEENSFTPESEDWEPYLEFIPQKNQAFQG